MGYGKIKQFANIYYEQLKLGKRPRAEIKREFYDGGRLIAVENTLDTIWISMMEGTYQPESKSLGRNNKKGTLIMAKEKKKRGPKSRPLYHLDPVTKEVITVYDSAEQAAQSLNISINTIRSIILGSVKKPKHLFVYDLTKVFPQTKVDSSEMKPSTPLVDEKKVYNFDEGLEIVEETDNPNVKKKIEEPIIPSNESEVDEKFTSQDNLMKNLDDARSAYIEALRKCVNRSINLYGIKLEENDMHLIAYLDEEVLKQI